MTKEKIKNILDYIPLFILTVFGIILTWTVNTSHIDLLWKHIAGLIFLPINYVLFFWRHKIGILCLGITLLLGLFSLLSYSPAISTVTLYKGSGDGGIPFFYGQPVFLLWLLLHYVLSGRHYVGILTTKYWQALSKNSTVAFY